MAVAAPLSFQHTNRIGWSSGDSNAYGSQMDADEVSKMFVGGPRKTLQRQNSSSSVASNNSSTSTISASSTHTSNTSVSSNGGDVGSWATKRKPSRGLWPPGKAEPATGLSTARSQPVSSASSGSSAMSATSALHAPILSSHQGTNGVIQNGDARGQAQNEPSAILHLLPINGTFERKTITVPYYPEVLRVGRQTNQKTLPTPVNGYFDSKVLSRQHAEVWADRQGRVFIRDVKSSNGTFVNGARLSQENKESEPRELREQDVLELGIDIVSEDQKTVVHHRVAAKVEHAGVYVQGAEALNFGDLDPSSGGGLMAASQQLKRNGSQGSLNGRNSGAMGNQGAMHANMMGQQVQARNWLNPITTEHIIKKLNAEMKLAVQQSQDLARARQCIDALLSGNKTTEREAGPAPDRMRSSPTKPKPEFKAQFADPPAPPPQAPLPEKPDGARSLTDSLSQPSLRRNDTAKPMSSSSSPSRDRPSEIVKLVDELELARSEIQTQTQKMKDLESQLAFERSAREDAEKQVQRLEKGNTSETATSSQEPPRSRSIFSGLTSSSSSDLQNQINGLQSTLDDMKQQMETYRRRAITAESERDEARQSLAELVESKRAHYASSERSKSTSRADRSSRKRHTSHVSKIDTNGHATTPQTPFPSSPTAVALLEKAGLDDGQPITPEQAKILTRLLSQEVLGNPSLVKGAGESNLMYHGRPLSAAALVVIFGVALMGWMNSWPRVER